MGTVRFEGLQVVEGVGNVLVVMNRSGSLVIQDIKGRDRERYSVVYGAHLRVADGQQVEQGQVLVEWDPYTFSIVTELAGAVRFKDIAEGITVHEEVDEVTGLSRLIIVDSPDEKKQPTVEIRGKDGKVLRKYHMPSHAHLMVARVSKCLRVTCWQKYLEKQLRPRTSQVVYHGSLSCSKHGNHERPL